MEMVIKNGLMATAASFGADVLRRLRLWFRNLSKLESSGTFTELGESEDIVLIKNLIAQEIFPFAFSVASAVRDPSGFSIPESRAVAKHAFFPGKHFRHCTKFLFLLFDPIGFGRFAQPGSDFSGSNQVDDEKITVPDSPHSQGGSEFTGSCCRHNTITATAVEDDF